MHFCKIDPLLNCVEEWRSARELETEVSTSSPSATMCERSICFVPSSDSSIPRENWELCICVEIL